MKSPFAITARKSSKAESRAAARAAARVAPSPVAAPVQRVVTREDRKRITACAWMYFRSGNSWAASMKEAWGDFKYNIGVFAPAKVANPEADRRAAAAYIMSTAERYYGANDLRSLMNSIMSHPCTNEADAAANAAADAVYQTRRCTPAQAQVIASSSYFARFAS